jgi:hypothetical protein
MKKFGLGFLALLAVGVIYYFTAGEKLITNEMKVLVNQELLKVEQNGFSVKERKIEEKAEHFVISFDDATKIKSFFEKQGESIGIEEAKSLIGLRVGVDLKYLSSALSAVSADIYPLNLPNETMSAKDLDEEEKIVVTHLNNMLKKKSLLLHIDFNKLLTSFKGNIKDIHESIALKKLVNINAVGMTFKGDIKNDILTSTSNAIENITLNIGNDVNISLANMKSTYKLTGDTIYDSNYDYTIGSLKAMSKEDAKAVSVDLSNITGKNITSVKNNLASNLGKVIISNTKYQKGRFKTELKDSTFVFNLTNLDMNILKKLETVDVENESEINALTQELISKGITIEVPKFEVKKLVYLGKEMDAFNITSSLSIKKSANLTEIQENPFAILSIIDTKTKVALSNDLYVLISQQPWAMLFAMMIRPQTIDGKKVYEVELKDGKVLVNGKAVM